MIDTRAPDFTNTPASPQRPRFGYALTDITAPPKVTIVTPFYNTSPIFHETASSVLQQSFQQWEWLIINDGSTDPQALLVLEAYRDKDTRIRVIDHSANWGLSASRNTGFREARAPYVVQLDSDDLLEPTAVEKWYWFLESYPEFSFCKGYSLGFGAQEYLWNGGFHDGTAFLGKNRADATSMVRRQVHRVTGGYEETNRSGLEDWDFWLRCASLGYWGATIPEYLNWYRRRSTHADQWPNFDGKEQEQVFQARLRERYPHLWQGGFPQIQAHAYMPNDTVPDELPCENHLRKDNPRLLMIMPRLTVGGVAKFNLDLLQQLTDQKWEVTIATTLRGDDSSFPDFARYTPDVFILHHFLRLVDYPRFFRYLIHSRQVDVVLISNSELDYLLLPYLRGQFPEVAFVDFRHIEDSLDGTYPQLTLEHRDLFDMNIVSSKHMKRWMVQRGIKPERIEVCNIEPDVWRPDGEQRARVRRELGLAETVPVILYAGCICLQKQPHVFATTMLRLRKQGVSFMALVAGDGPELRWLRSFIAKRELTDQVRLLGTVSIERIQELMAAADIFFLPSQWEGITLSIYEAMASGLAVVGPKIAGYRELVTAECGVMIEPSDEETEAARYAEIITVLLWDTERRAKMGQAARERVSDHFRLEQMEKSMLVLLHQAKGVRATQRRAVPNLDSGRGCATRAVDNISLRTWTQQQVKLWLEEQQAWVGELERGKARLEEQWKTWQKVAEERECIVQQQQTRVGELERGKAWLEEQCDNWQRLAEKRGQVSPIKLLRDSILRSLGLRS